jgi:hypothetical protein
VPLYVPTRGGRVKPQSETAAVLRDCSKVGWEEQKSEARNPKEIRSPKFEENTFAASDWAARRRPVSDFGFRASFGPRISDFGFQPGCHSPLAIRLRRRYIFHAGCGGKPAWLNQNRMSSTSELSSFAARLRGIIRASAGKPTADVPEFEHLALELFALQFLHNAPYRRLCEARGAHPGTVAHWTAIPAVPTSAFKEFELSCLPVAERTALFHSSGTTEQRPSRHFHNADSLALYETSLLAWFEPHLPLAIGDWQLAILTPPPSEAPHSSLVHMFDTIRRQHCPEASPFLGRAAADGTWALDLGATVEFIRNAADAGQPLLIFGTAFSYVHLLDYLAERGLRLPLPPGSCALETGGYKGRSRSLTKAALHSLKSRQLGIPPSHILCEYGMSELSSQAYDAAIPPHAPHSPLHAPRLFRFPPWACVQIISPETGCEVGEGETGLIRVLDLANVCSVMAIQTEDLGTRQDDGFTLTGRAASAEPRGCSLNSASDESP